MIFALGNDHPIRKLSHLAIMFTCYCSMGWKMNPTKYIFKKGAHHFIFHTQASQVKKSCIQEEYVYYL